MGENNSRIYKQQTYLNIHRMILELNYPKTGHAELSNCIIFIATPTPDVRDAGSRCQVCAPNPSILQCFIFLESRIKNEVWFRSKTF